MSTRKAKLPSTSELQDMVYCAQVTKAGKVYKFRRQFFYSRGRTAANFAANVIHRLGANGLTATVVESGEVHKAFRGSASVAQSSHWWVTVTIAEVVG